MLVPDDMTHRYVCTELCSAVDPAGVVEEVHHLRARESATQVAQHGPGQGGTNVCRAPPRVHGKCLSVHVQWFYFDLHNGGV
jgi:hypothetical protein